MTTQTKKTGYAVRGKKKVDLKLSPEGRKIQFFKDLLIALRDKKEAEGGILPSFIDENVCNLIGKGKRQINSHELNNAYEKDMTKAVFQSAFFQITKDDAQDSIFQWRKEDIADKDNPYKHFNSARVIEMFDEVKIEIQPMFTEIKQSKTTLAHYRFNKNNPLNNSSNALQMKESVLQPDNWYTSGLETFIHEMVHLINHYLLISDTSKKGQHNRLFQAMAIRMGLRTEYINKHCSTFELDEDFYSWFDKNWDVEFLNKHVFNVVGQQKKRSDYKKRRYFVNDKACWTGITGFDDVIAGIMPDALEVRGCESSCDYNEETKTGKHYCQNYA